MCKMWPMEIHKITFTAGMLLILASALIISCSSAPEASKPNTPRIENPKDDVGKDVNSFAQRVNPKQQDNAVSCQECDLRRASLVGANLRGADLSGASLWQANLSGADLFGAHLDGVIGADFSGALNVPAR